MITFRLPYPPSINRLYRRVGPRTLISRQGRAYRDAVRLALHGSGRFDPADRLLAYLQLHPPDRRKRDCDNSQKALIDSIQHAGVIPDDEQIDLLITERMAIDRPGGHVDVRLERLPMIVCPLCGGPMNTKE